MTKSAPSRRPPSKEILNAAIKVAGRPGAGEDDPGRRRQKPVAPKGWYQSILAP